MTQVFSSEMPIRITDINYGRHVGNDSVIALLHEFRVRWLASHGYSEMDCGGPGLILRRLEVNFLQQMRYGQKVVAEVEACAPGGASFSLRYRLLVDGTPAVEAVTEMGFYDYATGKVKRMPEQVRRSLFQRPA